jgi:uncharacterized protein (DUF952 family)
MKDVTVNYNDCYPGMSMVDEQCWRFTDKSVQENERLLFSNAWREQINQYGVKVSYFVNTYNVLSADNLYGEQPTSVFAPPRDIIMAVTLSDNAITLSKFGFLSEDDVTAFIHISSFEATFRTLSSVYETQYNIVEPKAGDVFKLTEFGDDRPNNRQAKYFEITEKLDEDISQINPLAGHYVFLIKAKRLDFSFEPGIPFNNVSDNITGNDQVYEDSFAGRLSGGVTEQSVDKKDNYIEYNADKISKEMVFDMSQNNTDVYGDYD